VAVAAAQDEVVITGSLGGGAGEIVISVRDAAGTVSDPLTASAAGWAAWSIDLAALLGPLLEVDGAPLTEARRGYIDAVGNGNGGYDVGDVRRWLRERGPE
jgi:hypothetical protein